MVVPVVLLSSSQSSRIGTLPFRVDHYPWAGTHIRDLADRGQQVPAYLS